MGAELITTTTEAKNQEEVKVKYLELVETAKYDHGHAGYSGSFAESPGVTIVKEEADDEGNAEDYIESNAQKWENSLAMKVKGTDTWVIGGCFSC